MSTPKEISDTLRQFVQTEILGDETSVSYTEDLLGDGVIDSLGIMRIVAHIESEYKFGVPPEDVTIEHFSTLDAMGRYIANKQTQI
ncbi:MAG: acyl carrier protein [Planctomycetaceae bacterium]